MDRKAIYCKDLQEVRQLTGIGGNKNSCQYEIILETNKGPTLMVTANTVDRRVSFIAMGVWEFPTRNLNILQEIFVKSKMHLVK